MYLPNSQNVDDMHAGLQKNVVPFRVGCVCVYHLLGLKNDDKPCGFRLKHVETTIYTWTETSVPNGARYRYLNSNHRP